MVCRAIGETYSWLGGVLGHFDVYGGGWDFDRDSHRFAFVSVRQHHEEEPPCFLAFFTLYVVEDAEDCAYHAFAYQYIFDGVTEVVTEVVSGVAGSNKTYRLDDFGAQQTLKGAPEGVTAERRINVVLFT